MKVAFSTTAWADYGYWQGEDRRTLRRINMLIHDVLRNGNHGIGKPERLTGNLTGWWSRRIDERHRLVYRLTAAGVEIAQCRYHYDDH